MANSIVKGKMNIVNKNGDVQTVYPETSGDKVLIDRSSNASVIPNDVSNLQHIINKMGSLALKSKITTSDFANNVITTDVNVTTNGKIADARVIKTLNDRITTIEDSDFIKTGNVSMRNLLPTWYFCGGFFEYELTDSGFIGGLDYSNANVTTPNSDDATYTINIFDYTFPDKVYGGDIFDNNIETRLNMYIDITEFINKGISIRISILKSGNMYSSGYLNTIINHNNSIPFVITNTCFNFNSNVNVTDILNIDFSEDSIAYYYDINLNDITVRFESDAYYLKFVISHFNNGKKLIGGNIFMNIEYSETVDVSKNLSEVLPHYYTDAQVVRIIRESLTNYYTKSQVDDIIRDSLTES